MLQEIFKKLALKTTKDEALCDELWQEMVVAYTQPSRHYHTLSHLENLIAELKLCRELIVDYDTVLYSVFYHDIMYDVRQQDNEECSAITAMEKLQMLHVDKDKQELCKEQILATKTHATHSNADINLFTDADLSILGKPGEVYRNYCKQVRQEYAIYPDNLYIPGRAKVLKHFLAMPRIYKTDFFYQHYESQARKNIAQELTLLQREE
jgi:predicted metal-dependent HD superfamily phosphohydrolase